MTGEIKYTRLRDIVDGLVTILEIAASMGSMIALAIYLYKDWQASHGSGQGGG